MNKPQSDLEERIRVELLKTGFPTEITVSSSLESIGWAVMHNPSYLDPQTGKSREFDIRAYKEFPEPEHRPSLRLGVYLLVECKKSEKPWVFFTTPCVNEIVPDRRIEEFIQTSKRIPPKVIWADGARNQLQSKGNPADFHHYFSQDRWARTFHHMFRGEENESSKQIYGAIMSVVNTVLFYRDNYTHDANWVPVFYPVIVFNGELFEAVVHTKTNLTLNRSDHLVLEYHLAMPSKYAGGEVREDTFLIDVLTDNFLSDFERLIDHESKTLLERMARYRGFETEKVLF